jgi:large subunit ribosomal protein L21
MYAIIETGGRQFWVTPGETIRVEKLKAETGQELTFKALWAVGDAKEGSQPASSRSATVVAQVKAQDRGPKIIVFKKRSKKAYKKTRGHRQWLTDLTIKSISIN